MSGNYILLPETKERPDIFIAKKRLNYSSPVENVLNSLEKSFQSALLSRKFRLEEMSEPMDFHTYLKYIRFNDATKGFMYPIFHENATNVANGLNGFIPNLKQFTEYLKILIYDKTVYDETGKAINNQERGDILDDLLGTREPSRSEWLSTYFSIRVGGKIVVTYSRFDSNGELVQVTEPLEEGFVDTRNDIYLASSISLEDWIKNPTEYGLPKRYIPGDLKYTGPVSLLKDYAHKYKLTTFSTFGRDNRYREAHLDLDVTQGHGYLNTGIRIATRQPKILETTLLQALSIPSEVITFEFLDNFGKNNLGDLHVEGNIFTKSKISLEEMLSACNYVPYFVYQTLPSEIEAICLYGGPLYRDFSARSILRRRKSLGIIVFTKTDIGRGGLSDFITKDVFPQVDPLTHPIKGYSIKRKIKKPNSIIRDLNITFSSFRQFLDGLSAESPLHEQIITCGLPIVGAQRFEELFSDMTTMRKPSHNFEWYKDSRGKLNCRVI